MAEAEEVDPLAVLLHRDVVVRKLVCAGTLEERIAELIERKKDLAERVVGTGEGWLTELSTDELRRVVTLSADAVVEPGAVTAAVQGSRARPYRIRIGLPRLSEADWRRAEAAMVSRAAFLARLLAGEMPEDIEEAFADCSLGLFPTAAGELESGCSCPDWADPCKHVAAVYYLLADAFDDDPFLLLRWRGREREELLRNLRALRGSDPAPAASSPDVEPWADIEAVEVPPLAARVDVFWQAGPAVTTLRLAPTAPRVPDAAVRALAALDRQVGGRPVTDVLEPAYATITSRAGRRLGGAT